MRVTYLILILYIAACKSDPESPIVQEKNVLGIEDYEQIVRHPISLDSNVDTSTWSAIEFKEMNYHFDTILSGDLIRHAFEFVNSGNKPLYILDTRVSCGCTVASYSESAIMPGDSGEIEVEFDSFGKSGDQNKSIIVLSNSQPNEDRLTITGYVKQKIN